MRTLAQIETIARERKGIAWLDLPMPVAATAEDIAATTDDRWLSMMARRVFQAGFVYRVIEAKWPGFEESFDGFDPARIATFGALEVDALTQDTRIVRNGQKIQATVRNARFIQEIAAEHGSFGRFVAAWPDEDIIGLWELLKKRGARLGGDTGPRLLRSMGKATFILTGDVVARLVAEGVVDKKPTSKAALRACQEAFNTWASQSGLDLTQISLILARSIDR